MTNLELMAALTAIRHHQAEKVYQQARLFDYALMNAESKTEFLRPHMEVIFGKEGAKARIKHAKYLHSVEKEKQKLGAK